MSSPKMTRMFGFWPDAAPCGACACATMMGALAVNADAAASVVPPSRTLRRLRGRSFVGMSRLYASFMSYSFSNNPTARPGCVQRAWHANLIEGLGWRLSRLRPRRAIRESPESALGFPRGRRDLPVEPRAQLRRALLRGIVHVQETLAALVSRDGKPKLAEELTLPVVMAGQIG